MADGSHIRFPRGNSSSTPTDEAESNYENLDLSFDDIEEEMVTASLERRQQDRENSDPTHIMKRAASSSSIEKGAHTATSSNDPLQDESYILGTVIIRVVAARDLEPVHDGVLGKLLFGGGGGTSRRRGSANPYAIVRFGSSTQRTSEVFDTVDPIWPRGEAMYMDVIHTPRQTISSGSHAATSDVLRAPKESAGDPPKKGPSPAVLKPQATIAQHPSTEAEKATSSMIHEPDLKDAAESKPILTVAVFHASEMGKLHKYPSKGLHYGDSDDLFLGMAAVDLTEVLTGKRRTFDDWLPLTGTSSSRASIRIVCEYEASDASPHPGDLVRFTAFCRPEDLYPAHADKVYKVEECDGDSVLISWISPEGWVSTFSTHRFSLICEERHQGAVEFYQDELVSLRQRLQYSPVANVLRQSVRRLPEEGLVTVGVEAFRGGTNLLTRWLQHGVGTMVGDFVHATNLNGQFNPIPEASLGVEDEGPDEAGEPKLDAGHGLPSDDEIRDSNLEPLPNMPPCPITGEPMRDPVVAADGHTYERGAIARWLATSDKSPLTGSVLPHKNLVPNYMLLSSLQEAAKTSSDPTVKSPTLEEDDATTEIHID